MGWLPGRGLCLVVQNVLFFLHWGRSMIRELWHCEMYGGSWHAALYHNGRKLFDQLFTTKSEANAALGNAAEQYASHNKEEAQWRPRMKAFRVSFQLFREFCNCRLHSQCLHCGNSRVNLVQSCCYNDCPVVSEAARQNAVEELESERRDLLASLKEARKENVEENSKEEA